MAEPPWSWPRTRSWMRRLVAPGSAATSDVMTGTPSGLGRVVALVRPTDQLVTEPEGEDDLGGRGKQGDDAHPAESRPGGGSAGQSGFHSSIVARAAARSLNQTASTCVYLAYSAGRESSG